MEDHIHQVSAAMITQDANDLEDPGGREPC